MKRALALLLSFAACSSEVPATNPFDPEAPPAGDCALAFSPAGYATARIAPVVGVADQVRAIPPSRSLPRWARCRWWRPPA